MLSLARPRGIERTKESRTDGELLRADAAGGDPAAGADIVGIPARPPRTVPSGARRGLERLRHALGAAGVLVTATALEEALAAEPTIAAEGAAGPVALTVEAIEAAVRAARAGRFA